MTEAAALLAAVAAQPDDDSPRLIYADWLDDHAEPERAEFIRVQVELARYDAMAFADCPKCECPDERYQHADDCPRSHKHPLRKLERELWDAPLVLSELPDASEIELPPLVLEWSAPHVSELLVRRGFVAEVRVPTLAAMVGGECGRCEGSGFVGCGEQHRHMGRAGGVYHGCRHHTDPHQSHHHHDNTCTQCPDCRGTGPTPSIAAELGRHPVERVWVGDREPYLQDIWVRGIIADSIHPHADLPVDIFDLLKGGIRPDKNRSYVRQYLEFTNRTAALDALAVACAEWCRREATVQHSPA